MSICVLMSTISTGRHVLSYQELVTYLFRGRRHNLTSNIQIKIFKHKNLKTRLFVYNGNNSLGLQPGFRIGVGRTGWWTWSNSVDIITVTIITKLAFSVICDRQCSKCFTYSYLTFTLKNGVIDIFVDEDEMIHEGKQKHMNQYFTCYWNTQDYHRGRYIHYKYWPHAGGS